MVGGIIESTIRKGSRMFQVTMIHFHAERDSYEDGCDPDTGHVSSYDYRLHADTVGELVNALSRHALWRDATPDDYELDSCGEPGRIDISGMVDDGWNPATKHEMERWRNGEEELYYATWTVYVQKVETVSLLD
jgi:hypothetical protein